MAVVGKFLLAYVIMSLVFMSVSFGAYLSMIECFPRALNISTFVF
jgi:hypothetical protein